MDDLTLEQKQRLKNKKVLIFTPFYMSQGFSQYFECLLSTVRALDKIGVQNNFISINGASYIWHARNIAAHRFMTEFKEYTDLFFIDSDMTWDVLGFLRVLSSKYDVVGAAYPMKNRWNDFSVRHYVNDDEVHTPKCTPDGLIEAFLVPGGFMRITRDCLNIMTREENCERYYWKNGDKVELVPHLFANGVKDKQLCGEDTSFCQKWSEIGGKVYCEPRVTFGHWGQYEWTGNYHEFLLKQPKNKQEGLRISI